MVYETELTEFSKTGIRYLVVGGIALVLHRHPRSTYENPEKRKVWITEKHMKAFSLINKAENPHKVIDVLVDSPLNFETAYKRRHKEKLDDIEIPVASLEDLLTLKLKANRAKDFQDIIVLQKFILRRKDD